MKILPAPRHELDLFALYFLVSFLCMPLFLQLAFSLVAFVTPLPASPYALSLMPPWVSLSVLIGGISVIVTALKMGIRFKYALNFEYWIYAIIGVLSLHFMVRILEGGDLITSSEMLQADPWKLVYLVILGPIFEEFVFRGLLYAWLCKKYSSTISAALTTLAFVLMHGHLFFGLYLDALSILALGLFLMVLRIKSDSLGPAMLAHCLNNGLSLLL
jgi:membrane protease YdiL (CAAX protease family)